MSETVQWQESAVSSPHIDRQVPVIAARNIPYFPNANRLQNLSIYLPKTSSTTSFVDKAATALPVTESKSSLPKWLVHVHGGAWRDPNLTSTSIEAAVAHAFNAPDGPLSGIIALNYTISPTPNPNFYPYDPVKDNHTHPEREALHPQHVSDVLHGLALCSQLGLKDGEYILSGHSCGACLSCQAIFQPVSHWNLVTPAVPANPPRPVAFLGFNGLYDLEQLVHGLGPKHAQLKDDYCNFIGIAFGEDQSRWPAASPARFDADDVADVIKAGPKLVILDQSTEDQLVPMNQRERLFMQLELVEGLKVVRGKRCVGKHSDVWAEGYMIIEAVHDAMKLLQE